MELKVTLSIDQILKDDVMTNYLTLFLLIIRKNTKVYYKMDLKVTLSVDQILKDDVVTNNLPRGCKINLTTPQVSSQLVSQATKAMTMNFFIFSFYL